MTPITHSKPWITDIDIRAVVGVLKSNMVAQGTLTRELEHRVSRWVHAVDGVATGSGSAALVLALHGVGVHDGDEVILPTYVCGSVLEAVLAVGGVPVLCDVGEDWVITADCAARRLTSKTKAVIVPHMYGVFAETKSLRTLGVSVIEDCAQAIADEGRRLIDSDVAIFSFHPTKILTAGEGGIAVSSDSRVVARMRALRDGIGTLDKPRLFSPMSDIAAGLALSQLRRYSEALAIRKTIAHRYIEKLGKVMPDCLNSRALKYSMFFRFPIQINGGLEACRDQFLKHGIHVRRGVDSLLHRSIKLSDDDYSISVKLFNSTVSLPIYPALTEEEVSRCVDCAVIVLSRIAVRHS